MIWLLSLPLAWLAAVMTMTLAQRRLIYRPEPSAATPEAAATPWLRPVHQDGKLLGWWVPPRNAKGLVLVVFHGNRGTLARVAAKTAPWHQWGFGLFLATYRGYEGNSGKPSEAGLYEDGRAVLDWLTAADVTPEQQVLYGESLGCGVAIQLAGERPARALVLEAPFTSIPDLAAQRHPWAPTRRLLRHRFDNQSKISTLKLPLLILHGQADRTTPCSHSRALAAAQPNAVLSVLPKAGHLDLYDHGAIRSLSEFLTKL